MALLFNRGTLEPGIATATNYVYGSTATAVTDIKTPATDNKFVMTSKAEQKTIQDNISEETVKTGTGEAQNVFSFDMERVVSQGMVAKGADLDATTADGKGSVDLDNLTYAAINGAAKTYLFRNHAEIVQSQRETGFTKISHPPLMIIQTLVTPKIRTVLPRSI